ncbi:hypothetical protein B0H13DRAFT_2268435 [Mycena leptocephala]|nr:hypothetical protein B0H13DRAFT_2268435 [Mycena leptocephala]
MVSLPQELIDDIVSYVEDRPSQEACSLVAKTFALPSQRILFRRMSFVTLDFGLPDAATRRLQQAAEIFAESPHLVPFVRTLEILMLRTLEGCAALEAILRALRVGKVRHLTIRGSLDHIRSSLRERIAEFIFQASLQDVVFITLGVAHPSLIADAFASCSKVSLSCQYISDSDSLGVEMYQPQEKTGGHAHVEELIVMIGGGSGNFFSRPNISQCMGRLRHLEIHLDDFLVIHAACRTTLTHLTLYNFSAAGFRKFPRLEALHSLTLWAEMSKWPAELSAIAASLPTAVPLLEVLTMAVVTNYYSPPLEHTSYPEIDAALAILLHLREMKLTLMEGYSNHVDPIPYRQCFEAALPQALEAGLLTFTVDPSIHCNPRPTIR